MISNDPILPADMQCALDDFETSSNETLELLAQSVEARELPDTIYHYTDSAGLLGMLFSGAIRLTDILGLNDPSELRHGINYARAILPQEAKGGHRAAHVFASQFDKIMSGAIENTAHFFVGCFSTNGDELGQWRAYGDNGTGFVLAFDRRLLESAFVTIGDTSPNNSSFLISYNDTQLKEIQSALAKKIVPLIAMPHGRQLPEPAIRKYIQALSMQLGVCAMRAAIYFKHEAYKNEGEYRFLQIRQINDPMDDLQHRARRMSLVRFTQFPWKQQAIPILRKIVLGPASDEREARLFVENCLRVGGLLATEVPVERSTIPYRG